MEFKSQLEEYRLCCENALEHYAKPLFQKGSTVSEAASYGLFSGGKRVRGVLVLAVCDMLQGNMQAALPLAASIEMMHAFSLIHDDLPCMDDDEMRRGKPAVHIVYGEATALLAGDLLAIQAFEAACAEPVPPEIAAQAVRILSAAAGARGMIYGQELDKHFETEAADEKALYAIHHHKTGALISAATKLGMACAQLSNTQRESIVLYAYNIGVVFQIVDDILDVTSSSEVLGKPVGSDEKQGKVTFASLNGLEASRKEVNARTEEAVATLESNIGKPSLFLSQFARHLATRAF